MRSTERKAEEKHEAAQNDEQNLEINDAATRKCGMNDAQRVGCEDRFLWK